ncbi:unnamed protein product [Protopolystoma xenopodis]|uniref:Uncharacterized protein n=1 Tax=Protopolystoma xenopodis TaxID=117903 RepID=A0A3S5AC11_9PLAT|nr:unnamed protein product [Protopolystoma xenopodis]
MSSTVVGCSHRRVRPESGAYGNTHNCQTGSRVDRTNAATDMSAVSCLVGKLLFHRVFVSLTVSVDMNCTNARRPTRL